MAGRITSTFGRGLLGDPLIDRGAINDLISPPVPQSRFAHHDAPGMPEIVLVEPEIPQNTGNIGRTCVGLGWKLWLVGPLGYELSDKYLRRAGLDYWQHLEYEVLDNLDSMLNRFANRRRWYFSKKATQIYTEVEYATDDVLIFGKETKGLPESLLAANASQTVRIPMRPEARSLNLATAVAIGGYEVVRQLAVNQP